MTPQHDTNPQQLGPPVGFEAELDELTRPIAEVVREARESHLLMNNCYRDYAVRNAAQLRDLVNRHIGD